MSDYKKPYKVFFYKTAAGNMPVKAYLDDLRQSNNPNDLRIYQDVLAYIEMLSMKGNTLGTPYIKKLHGTELWELRPRSERVIYCMIEGNTVYLLHAFTKKSQKTPKKEIDTAMIRYKQLLRIVCL